MKTTFYLKFLTVAFIFSIYSERMEAQTFKNLLKEDFGVPGTPISSNPATLIFPGTTDYLPKTTNPINDGQYGVVTNPNLVDDFGGGSNNQWQDAGDHTTGSQYMMLINANPARQGETNGTYYLFSTGVFDIPGATYQVNLWAANVIIFSNTTAKAGFLGIAVRDNASGTGTRYNSTGVNTWVLPRATGNRTNLPWQNLTSAFTLPLNYNSPALYFNFFNSDTNPSTSGNDLVLDDINVDIRVKATVSGNVFTDGNGDRLLNGTDQPFNGVATPLFAYVTDVNGRVIAKVQVGADGTYVFTNEVPWAAGDIGLKISISTNNVALGQPVTPAAPAGYVITGENVSGTTPGAASVGTPKEWIVNLTNTDDATTLTNINFAVDAAPTAGGGSNTALNPGGTTQIPLPANTFTSTSPSTDPSGTTDGVTAIRITAFPPNATTLVVNGISYTPATFPSGGVTVPADASGNPTQPITVDPAFEGSGAVSISFVAVDAAGVESSNTGTAVLNVTSLSVSGTVFNDNNGGTPDGTAPPAGLVMNVYDAAGNFTTSVPVAPDGTYALNGLSPGNYQFQLNSNAGTAGQNITANPVVLPGNLRNVSSTDGSPDDGVTSVSLTGTGVSGVNFGVNEVPTAQGSTTAATPNPKGTTNSGSISNAFGGTDPNGGAITAVTITGFPSNATSITIDGVMFTTLTAIQTAYPNGIPTNASGVPVVPILIDPVDGAVTVDIPFTVTDNAGLTSTPSTVSVPFTDSSLPVKLIDFSVSVLEKSTAYLSWSTAWEMNSKVFVVERSADTREWVAIGAVFSKSADGNSQKQLNYNYVDSSPFSGINYYRLKQMDSDEKFEYSRVKSVDLGTEIRAYPNPARAGRFAIKGLLGTETVRAFAVNGREVQVARNGEAFSIADQPAGVYLVQVVRVDGTVIRLKVVRNNDE